MLALIPLLPFLGYLVNVAFGRRLSKGLSGGLASLVMVASFAVSVVSVWQLAARPADARMIDQLLYTWIASEPISIDLAFRLDPLGAVMVLVVTGIGSLIHVYSTAYMHEESDREFARYFSYLNLFAAFMLVLVLGANFLVMFVGWEGVGLCSYLLIGFWFRKKSASDAGKKAFIVNRIGDYGFILGMLLIAVTYGTLDFHRVAGAIAPLAPEAAFGTLSVAALLLFVGATGKSAQIPLYVWLPDAMEGPTPVSALIHAATMVTAGVYMIGRNAVLFSHAPITMEVVAVIGAATALMAGTIGLVQNDIKRVLAYSTVSQLGYMFLAMGVGAFGAGIFHLYTHAFFKALLFLGSGAVIHALHGEQDVRNMGGLRRDLPVTYWTFLVGALAIAGVPGLAGFFSKDEILFETFWDGHRILWTIGILTSLLTATYMFRLVFLTFHGERRTPAPASPHDGAGTPHASAASPHDRVSSPHDRGGAPHDSVSTPHDSGHAAPAHLHDAPPAMALVLIVLAIGSVLAGYIGVPHALGGHNTLGAWLAPSFHASAMPAAGAELGVVGKDEATEEAGAPDGGGAVSGESARETAAKPPEDEAAKGRTETLLMAVSSIVALVGIGIASVFFLKNLAASDRVARAFPGLHRLLLNKYYVDEVYDAAIVQPIRVISQEGLWKGFDVQVVDGAVNGAGSFVNGWAWILRRLQTGSVRTYAGSVFLGVVLILGYYLWR